MENTNFRDYDFDKMKDRNILEFPVSYNLKVIFDTDEELKILNRNLELVLEDSNVKYEFMHSRHSNKGKYVSFTVKVTIDSEKQMHYFYDRLKLLPGIKFAV